MNTYLERLATTVRNPSKGIVPLVRPLYLPPPVEEQTLDTSLEQLEEEAPPATTVSTDDPRPAERKRTVHAATSLPPMQSPPSFEPLLPELPAPAVNAPPVRGETEVADKRPTPGDVNAVASLEATPARGETSPASDLPSKSAQGTPRRAELRFAAPTATTPAAPHPMPVDRDAPIGPGSPRSVGARHSGQRPPDKIQIHIGRVEVVAVPPAEQAPEPRRRERKSLNLDRYLESGG
jgi:hypothetical protein